MPSGGNLYTVNALVPNPDGRFLSGSSATLALPRGTRRAILVPADAIVRQGDLTGVRTSRRARPSLRWVKLGRTTRRHRSRCSPASRAGDTVLVAGGSALSMGIAGRVAQAFLRSKLTPLVTIASLAVGALAMLATPREEEPQISVPMIDVMAALPGASPAEVENLLTRPIEKLMWEVPGVEYVYAMAGEGMTLVTVRFKVGEDQDRAVSRVFAKIGVGGRPRACRAPCRRSSSRTRSTTCRSWRSRCTAAATAPTRSAPWPPTWPTSSPRSPTWRAST